MIIPKKMLTSAGLLLIVCYITVSILLIPLPKRDFLAAPLVNQEKEELQQNEAETLAVPSAQPDLADFIFDASLLMETISETESGD